MSKLTDAFVMGALGLALTAGAYAADVTKSEKNGAKARYEAAAEKARADYKVAKERCNTLAGQDKELCLSDAAVEKAKADYKIARERCDTLTGNEKDVCVAQARADEQRVRADAKARKEAAKAGDEADEEKCPVAVIRGRATRCTVDGGAGVALGLQPAPYMVERRRVAYARGLPEVVRYGVDTVQRLQRSQ